VKDQTNEEPFAPIWARPDVFPVAPEGWGWVSVKGSSHPCESHAALVKAISEDRDASVELVWDPRTPRMMLPEELAGVGNAILTARTHWSQADIEETARKMRWFGLIFLGLSSYVFLGNFLVAGNQVDAMSARILLASKALVHSTQTGLSLLMFVIFAFIPWYQARKERSELRRWSEERLATHSPAIRFETWLGREKAPLTQVFLGMMVVVSIAQIFGHWSTRGWASLGSLLQNWDGIIAAGLEKEAYRTGEWWRVFTAPFLHGNLVHFLMNASGLAYLGKRLEILARWPHLPMVFLFSAWAGGLCSAHFVSAPTVGASGGLMGWLGFLLVFETLHKELVPLRARRRLAAGVLLTAFIGLVGYRYVDNAAHAGGLLAGMVYGWIVFTRSASMRRPRSTLTDRLAGAVAMLVLIASAALAIAKLVSL
jgi:membrane associated rhomboid family serine protease